MIEWFFTSLKSIKNRNDRNNIYNDHIEPGIGQLTPFFLRKLIVGTWPKPGNGTEIWIS